MKSIVIVISGRGSNMRAIVEARLPLRVAAVISNRADAAGLAYAREQGIAVETIDHRQFPTREAFDMALAEACYLNVADCGGSSANENIQRQAEVDDMIGLYLYAGVVDPSHIHLTQTVSYETIFQ